MICGCLPPIRVRKDQNTIVGGVRECGRFRNWRYAGESCTVSGKKSSELSEGDTVEYAGEFFCIFVWTMGALAGALLAGVVSSSARNNQDTSPPEDDGWLRGQVLLAWLIK